ncbi:MAG: beta-lactamase family protein [Oscillospiraceae bacterium]|jgi:CubicO group peptidase (beta-lactamase class C family)|nr:beta-lactamase family protein [Oscillospiraceae bacterium]
MKNTIKLTAAQAETLGIEAERLEWLDAYLQRMIDDKKHPFESFRVWRKETLIFSGDYGTQTPNGEPLRADAIYPLQSATKPVLAACAAILQEEGRVNFFDKLQDHFPEFEGENKDYVLLWHLLSHSSGMDGDDNDKFITEYREKETGKIWSEIQDNDERLDAMMSLRPKLGLPEAERNWYAANEAERMIIFKKAPLTALPGTRFSYWSTGYSLWKEIIERITGDTLEAYARRKIFEPLGMHDTHWALPKEKYDRRVIRADGFKGAPWIDDENAMNSTSASGGLKSTMDDMAKFGLMFLNGGRYNGKRVMSPASVKLLTRNHNNGIPSSFWFGRMLTSSWGLGWDIKEDKIDDTGMLHSPSSYNHGGFGGAKLLVDPEYDLVLSMYMCEQSEFSIFDDLNCAVDILYGALD